MIGIQFRDGSYVEYPDANRHHDDHGTLVIGLDARSSGMWDEIIAEMPMGDVKEITEGMNGERES